MHGIHAALGKLCFSINMKFVFVSLVLYSFHLSSTVSNASERSSNDVWVQNDIGQQSSPWEAQPLHWSDRQMTVATTLSAIRKEINEQPFSPAERQNVLQIAISVIEGLNPNFNMRNRFLNVNPVAEMRAFSVNASSVTNFEFHIKMIEIFTSMRDRHTYYLPPEPLYNSGALLGVVVAPFVNSSTGLLQFIVTEISDGVVSEDLYFRVGVTVLAVDGVPIKQLVIRTGRNSGAANVNAQLREGSAAVTFRVLALDTIPRKAFATIQFLDDKSIVRAINLPWLFISRRENTEAVQNTATVSRSPNAFFHNLQSMRLLLRKALSIEKDPVQLVDASQRALLQDGAGEIPQFLLSYYRLASFKVSGTTFGYLGVRGFDAPTTPEAFRGLRNLVALLPNTGLMIDIRGNPGGISDNIYALLRTFSSVTVDRAPQVFRASRLHLQFIKNWLNSPFMTKVFADAVRLGEPYTGPAEDLFPLEEREVIDRLGGPVFNGPVVVVSDAMSASASEIFSALCRDYGACYVINVDGTTAGAGDTVVTYSTFRELDNKTFTTDLPLGIQMGTAYGRLFRYGPRFGALITYVGIEPDEKYNYTRADLLGGSDDLLQHVGRQLLKMMAS